MISSFLVPAGPGAGLCDPLLPALFVFCMQTTLNIPTWVVLSEMFPLDMRGLGMGIRAAGSLGDQRDHRVRLPDPRRGRADPGAFLMLRRPRLDRDRHPVQAAPGDRQPIPGRIGRGVRGRPSAAIPCCCPGLGNVQDTHTRPGDTRHSCRTRQEAPATSRAADPPRWPGRNNPAPVRPAARSPTDLRGTRADTSNIDRDRSRVHEFTRTRVLWVAPAAVGDDDRGAADHRAGHPEYRRI